MGLGRIGNERELGVLLSQIAFVARMLAAVVVINEGTEAGNGHERREPDHGQQESERSSAQPAEHTLSKDRRARRSSGRAHRTARRQNAIPGTALVSACRSVPDAPFRPVHPVLVGFLGYGALRTSPVPCATNGHAIFPAIRRAMPWHR